MLKNKFIYCCISQNLEFMRMKMNSNIDYVLNKKEIRTKEKRRVNVNYIMITNVPL